MRVRVREKLQDPPVVITYFDTTESVLVYGIHTTPAGVFYLCSWDGSISGLYFYNSRFFHLKDGRVSRYWKVCLGEENIFAGPCGSFFYMGIEKLSCENTFFVKLKEGSQDEGEFFEYITERLTLEFSFDKVVNEFEHLDENWSLCSSCGNAQSLSVTLDELARCSNCGELARVRTSERE